MQQDQGIPTPLTLADYLLPPQAGSGQSGEGKSEKMLKNLRKSEKMLEKIRENPGKSRKIPEKREKCKAER